MEAGVAIQDPSAGRTPSALISYFEMPAAELKSVLSVAAAIVDGIKLTFGPDGLKFSAVDTGHVAMLVGSMPPSCFRHWGFKSEVSVALALAPMLKALRRLGPREPVMFEVGRTDELLPVPPQGRGAATLVCGPMRKGLFGEDPSSLAEPKVPKLMMTATAVLPRLILERIIKMAGDVGDHIAFELHRGPGGLRFRAVVEGDDGDLTFDLGWPDLVSASLDAPLSKVRSTYPLDYFECFSKVIPSGQVTLRFGDEWPMRIEFSLIGGGGQASFLVAPRIEND